MKKQSILGELTMLTRRENLLETIKPDGKPDRLTNCYTAFKPIGGDPVFQYVRGNRIRGTNSYDRWGTYISFPEDQPAARQLYQNWRDVLAESSDRWVRIAGTGIGLLGLSVSALVLHRLKMFRRWRRHHLSRRKAEE